MYLHITSDRVCPCAKFSASRTGVVRAGQWSRRLIINNGLDEGSQLLYIKRAIDRGYSVLVMNTNQNKDLSDEKAWISSDFIFIVFKYCTPF